MLKKFPEFKAFADFQRRSTLGFTIILIGVLVLSVGMVYAEQGTLESAWVSLLIGIPCLLVAIAVCRQTTKGFYRRYVKQKPRYTLPKE